MAWPTSSWRRARWCRGIVGVYRSDPSAAEDLAAARELAERTHDDVNLGDICGWQGALALALGQEAEGCRVLVEAAALADHFRPVTGARIRCLLAEAAIRRGDLVEAGRWLDEALELPSARQLALVVRAQARLARAKGDLQRALQLADEGLGSARPSGAQLLVVDFLELLAFLAADNGRYVEAAVSLAPSPLSESAWATPALPWTDQTWSSPYGTSDRPSGLLASWPLGRRVQASRSMRPSATPAAGEAQRGRPAPAGPV